MWSLPSWEPCPSTLRCSLSEPCLISIADILSARSHFEASMLLSLSSPWTVLFVLTLLVLSLTVMTPACSSPTLPKNSEYWFWFLERHRHRCSFCKVNSNESSLQPCLPTTHWLSEYWLWLSLGSSTGFPHQSSHLVHSNFGIVSSWVICYSWLGSQTAQKPFL